MLDLESLMVCARPGHLDSLRGVLPVVAESPVIETPQGDCRWRVVTQKAVISRFVADLVARVDHANFKTAWNGRALSGKSAEPSCKEIDT
ncbi:MAG: hypothetical protein U1F36_17235 [Planctomycetota bacterium]